jgi:hypothetical protein
VSPGSASRHVEQEHVPLGARSTFFTCSWHTLLTSPSPTGAQAAFKAD